MLNAIDPAHYKGRTLETRQVIKAYRLAPDLANVFKYLCRYDRKNGAEDVAKAIRYLRLFATDPEAQKIQRHLWDLKGSPVELLGGLGSCDVAEDFSNGNASKGNWLGCFLLLYYANPCSLPRQAETLADSLEAAGL
jgi:hypothetical protein